jgi:hypothetical protein
VQKIKESTNTNNQNVWLPYLIKIIELSSYQLVQCLINDRFVGQKLPYFYRFFLKGIKLSSNRSCNAKLNSKKSVFSNVYRNFCTATEKSFLFFNLIIYDIVNTILKIRINLEKYRI